MAESVDLVPVDAVEVTVAMDNSIDILAAPSDLSGRPPWRWDWSDGAQLRAEHGYSLAVTVHRDGHTDTILYDAGLSRDGTMHNLDVLEIDPGDIRAIVLSHGHADHHGGLEGLFGRTPREMPLVLHPDAWQQRKVVFPSGEEIRMPPPSQQDLDREGWQIVEETGPSLLLDGAVLVTGQVERLTDYEQGFPLQFAQSHTGWDKDTWIWDDQAIVIKVRGKGLVVLSSCSHSGVINVLRHAQRMTGEQHIHGFVGGLHLTGGLFEPILPATMDDLVEISPEIIVPGHCTGWKATHAVARALPDAYAASNVGTTFKFAGNNT